MLFFNNFEGIFTILDTNKGKEIVNYKMNETYPSDLLADEAVNSEDGTFAFIMEPGICYWGNVNNLSTINKANLYKKETVEEYAHAEYAIINGNLIQVCYSGETYIYNLKELQIPLSKIELNTNYVTGTKIKIKDGEEFKVVIYGDITGDGEIEPVDALTLIKSINEKIKYKGEEFKEAGKIISKDSPTAVDALAIIKHLNGKYTIKQSK